MIQQPGVRASLLEERQTAGTGILEEQKTRNHLKYCDIYEGRNLLDTLIDMKARKQARRRKAQEGGKARYPTRSSDRYLHILSYRIYIPSLGKYKSGSEILVTVPVFCKCDICRCDGEQYKDLSSLTLGANFLSGFCPCCVTPSNRS